jgi:perosamine synthetase
MDAISEIAREHGLKVIEDCAEAFGARYRGRPVGCLGDVGCFSFYANKVITTGEGGMVLTQDKRLHDRMVRLRDHGMEKSRRYWHVEPGFNFRMTNIQAAIGLAQMERVEGFLQRRVEIGRRYREGLGAVPGIVHPPSANWADRIYWLYCIEVEAGTRDSLMNKLRKAGIDTRAVFPPLNVQPAFGSEPAGRHPVGESYAARGICLPTSNGMTDGEIDRVVNEIAAVMN